MGNARLKDVRHDPAPHSLLTYGGQKFRSLGDSEIGNVEVGGRAVAIRHISGRISMGRTMVLQPI